MWRENINKDAETFQSLFFLNILEMYWSAKVDNLNNTDLSRELAFTQVLFSVGTVCNYKCADPSCFIYFRPILPHDQTITLISIPFTWYLVT